MVDRYSDVVASLPGILGHPVSGKSGDVFNNPINLSQLFPVRSDRISTHDVVHLSEFPQKGEILNALPVFYAVKVFENIPNHLIAWGRRVYDHLPKSNQYHPRLHYRGVVVVKQRVTKFELIHRNRNAGSYARGLKDGWKKYGGKNPYGLDTPLDTPLLYPFPKPIFTPTDKSKTDDPRLAAEVTHLAPFETKLSLRAFIQLTTYLASRGITLIDGKFEASLLMLLDEWGTGDCCRMAWTKEVKVGVDPPWLDKELPRQEAMRLWGEGPKVPLVFPDDVIKKSMAKYHEAFEGITGMTLSTFQKEYFD